MLQIDIYFKNRDEPKKVTYEYDLDLAPVKIQSNEFIIHQPSEDFRRKCIKGGGYALSNINNSSDHKSRDSFGKVSGSAINDIKKISKPRPDEVKQSSTFANLFGPAIMKKPSSKVSPDPRAQNSSSSPNPTKLQSSGKGMDKSASAILPTSGSSGKDKGEKSKHKHSPNKEKESSKETKKAVTDDKFGNKEVEQKSKKDKGKEKERERSEKKEKSSKRPSSPSPASVSSSNTSATASNARNSTNISKTEFNKAQAKPISSVPTEIPTDKGSSVKKSSKKDKKSSYDKDRERSDKKDSRKESLSAKDKMLFESTTATITPVGTKSVKERDSNVIKEETREKLKIKTNNSTLEPKNSPNEPIKKPEKHDKDSERKHKHKKKEKEKTKDKEPTKEKKEKKEKEKTSKSSSIRIQPVEATQPLQIKSKDSIVQKYEAAPTKAQTHINRNIPAVSTADVSDKDSSDSDMIDSPPSLKQESENSIPDPVVQKPPPEVEKSHKKSREKSKGNDKDEKKKKRKLPAKEDRDSSSSPPPAKIQKKDLSKSPLHERPSSSDSSNALLQQKPLTNNNNNNIIEANNSSGGSDRKISNEYMSELKDLKHKITTLQSNDDLQKIVRLIASTGNYEITNKSFDFDLVQLDRSTIQRLQEFFASS